MQPYIQHQSFRSISIPFSLSLSLSLSKPSMASPPMLVLPLLLMLSSLVNGVPGSIGGMAEDELLGLFDVAESLLADPNWVQLHPHPCTDTPWPGIQCEMQQERDPLLHVTKLHIGPDVASPSCKPSANLSSSLLKLPYLKSFSLFNCFLSINESVHLSPFLFTDASSLEQLVIKSNPGLTGPIPSTIAQLKGLRVLTLSQNNLQGSIPKELGGLLKLEQMDLSYNHLNGHVPEPLGELLSLTILDLSYNEIDGRIPSSMGQLQSLQKLDLSSNNFSGTVPQEVGMLASLVLLDLSHNALTGPIPEAFSALKSLEYFIMEDNPIGTAMPKFFAALKKLSVLGLSGCGLGGAMPSYFDSLCNLTALSLDRNNLNGSIPPGLDGLPYLGQLNLSQNQLRGEICFSEVFVDRLGKRLDVSDNKGLCRNPKMKHSMYAKVPACLYPLVAKDEGNTTWAEEPGVDSSDVRVRPSWSDGMRGGACELVRVKWPMLLCCLWPLVLFCVILA